MVPMGCGIGKGWLDARLRDALVPDRAEVRSER
jgi:hypothetical protein